MEVRSKTVKGATLGRRRDRRNCAESLRLIRLDATSKPLPNAPEMVDLIS
jgi:hypothetical protein